VFDPLTGGVFTVNPATYMMAKAVMSDTGIVTTGMIAARKECRNKRIMRMTSAAASRIVVNTFLIERSMKTVESNPTSIEVPWHRLVDPRQHAVHRSSVEGLQPPVTMPSGARLLS
jgi:hypothetical protein